MTVLDIITEPLKANFPKMAKSEMELRAAEIAKGWTKPQLLKLSSCVFRRSEAKNRNCKSFDSHPGCAMSLYLHCVSIQAQVINLLRSAQKWVLHIFLSAMICLLLNIYQIK